jgi:hypothetical protein
MTIEASVVAGLVLLLTLFAGWLLRTGRRQLGVVDEAKRVRRLEEQLAWDQMRDHIDNPS